MSSQRLFLAFVVLATLAVVAQCDNAVFGQRQPGDSLVKNKNVQAPAISGRGAVAQDTYAPDAGRKITAIELVDRNGDKSAAHAKIMGGGPGKSYVTVGFQSNAGFGIDYEIKYYAV